MRDGARARRRAIARAIAFGVVALLLLGIGGEVSCRIRYGRIDFPPDWDLLTRPDPDLGRRFVPGSRLDFALLPGSDPRASIPVRLNRLGYRGPDPPPEKAPGTFRIACLGDSTTFGWKVREEEAYSSLLASLLEKESGGKRVECLNFGAPEHTTFRARFVLEKDALPLRPDLVVFAYGFNDSDVFEDDEVLHARRRADPESLLAWRLRRALSGSYLFQWIRTLLPRRSAVAAPPSVVHRVSPERIESNLRDLKARARAAGAEVVLVHQNIPGAYGLDAFRRAAEDSPLVEARSALFPGGDPPSPSGSERGLRVAGEGAGARSSLLVRLLAPGKGAWDVVGLRSPADSVLRDRERLRDDGTAGDEKPGDGVHSLLFEGPFAGSRVEFAFVPASHSPETPGLFRSREFFFHEAIAPGPGLCRATALFSPAPPSPPMLPGDVIHPDAQGHRRIAEALARAIASSPAFRRFAGE